MITYDLTNTGSDTLYECLYKNIKNDILHGILKSGEKLPSKRVLASNLGVSVITVENAYARLGAEGYIYSMPKRGFYVADFSQPVTAPKEERIQEMAPVAGGDTSYFADFSSNQTSSELFPFTIWSKVIRELLNDSRVQLMTNSPCGVIPALREEISKYLQEYRGMSVRTEQIIIGAGTEYLYGLLIQLLGNDKVYAIENPGYRKLEHIYESFRVPCRRISMDACGILVSELEEKEGDVVHITPSHHYPTGIVMPISRRYELLGWAAKKEQRYIIEDDYDSELRLGGRPIPTLQSIDQSEKVIYMNTFTKTLCSTVRISYMILPPGLVRQFYKKMSFYSCTVSNFEQYTLAYFMAEGKFEAHINRLRNHYRKKRDMLLQAFADSKLKDKISVSGQEAGLHFLMTLHTDMPEAAVMERALSQGVKLIPLSRYFYGEKGPENVYVMNYSSIDITKADEIAKRIYKSLQNS